MFRSLRSVKVIHTIIWVFFVACIVAIPVLTSLSRYRLAGVFAGIVAVEVLVLVVNRMSCPLTGVASRFTEDRRANFDIYLPEWLARHNKTIFGSLYVVSVVYLLARWLSSA
ncbi:MAG: hypothetical protein R3178_03000 [Rhodothermales bacterium]|nr:hypothetical protein [Rhodothermales bacterium]